MEEELKNIEKIKEIPKDVKKSIDIMAYYNILIATIIMAVCVLLLFGFKYIEPIIFIAILKAFCVIALAGAILIIEIAYKKDSGKFAIHAIEMIAMAFGILSLPYLYTYNIYNFPFIVTAMSSLFGAYYGIKGIFVVFYERKKYRKNSNDIKDITK